MALERNQIGRAGCPTEAAIVGAFKLSLKCPLEAMELRPNFMPPPRITYRFAPAPPPPRSLAESPVAANWFQPAPLGLFKHPAGPTSIGWLENGPLAWKRLGQR